MPSAFPIAVGAFVFSALVGCGSQAGTPAAPAAVAGYADATVTEVADAGPTPPSNVELEGTVPRTAADGGIPGAVVIAEVGGLGGLPAGEPGPDGGLVPTVAVDPFIRSSVRTGSRGQFELSLPPGRVGLHVFDQAHFEWLEDVSTPGSPVLVSLEPLPGSVDAGRPLPVLRPIVTGLSASIGSPEAPVEPLAAIVFSVHIAAGFFMDPLSSEIFIVERHTRFAGQLAPPVPVVPGGPYPDGVYTRIVEAPAVPGTYEYLVVAASMAKIPNKWATIHITVTENGQPNIPDAGDLDAYATGTSGLPDGRH